MTKDEFSVKQNEIFDEIEDLRSQLAIFLESDNEKKLPAIDTTPKTHHSK